MKLNSFSDVLPLTFAERQMATEQAMNPETIAYNINFHAIRIEGCFDANKFEDALNKLVMRHAVLRSYYPLVNGEYQRKIRKKMHVEVVRRSCDEKEVVNIINSENRPFNLADDQLLRCQLFAHGENLYTLHFCFHHIIFDGNSWHAFEKDLFALYSGETLSPLKFDYQDYAAIQAQRTDLDEKEEILKKMFEDGVPENDMPIKSSRPAVLPCANIDIVRCVQNDAVSLAAKRFGTTRFVFLLGVLGMVLGKYCASEDVVIGTAMSGRTLPEHTDVIGMFVNSLPVRIKPASDMRLCDYMAQTLNTVQILKANQTYPFEKLVPILAPNRNPSRSPVFDLLFNYIHEKLLPTIKGVNSRYLNVKGQTLQMDLLLEATQKKDEIELVLSYSKELYDDVVVENFMEQFITTLERCCKDDGSALLTDLLELPKSQYQQITTDFVGQQIEGWQGKTIVSLFREQVAKTPNNRAVVFKDISLTYAQLDHFSDNLAAHLKSHGVGKGKVVGIMVDRGIMMIICSLAVLKTGAAYLPMDATYPTERLQHMITDANACVLLCDANLSNKVPLFLGTRIFTCDIEKLPSAKPLIEPCNPDDLFILLYTSGTTGKPKGVMLTNRNLTNYAYFYSNLHKLNESDNVAAHASFGFDANMMDMYPTLFCGACLHIIPEEMRLDLLSLRDYFEKNNITLTFLTTQLGRQFAESMKVSRLRALSVGGETLSPITPPSFDVFNIYGPTECTVACTTQHVDKFYDKIPIGKATPNTALYVVDSRGKLAPVGVAGELYISGEQVAKGYLNRPDLTAEKFIANPFSDNPLFARAYKSGDVVRFLPDGRLDFVGRRDFQVKIRGFRVELTEIESRIRAYKAVKDATVVAQEDAGGGKRIVAYVVSDSPVDIKALNEFIEQELPSYMVPAATMQIDSIPINQNGKVNRKELPHVHIKAEEIIAPRTDLEKIIFEITASILGFEDFGVTTDLMYAGLNSLSAIKASAMISERTGKKLQTSQLMREKTIEKIAKILEKSDSYQVKSYQKQELYPLTQNQLGLYFSYIKDPSTLAYNIPFEISFGKNTDTQKLLQSVRRVLDAHSYLKTRFQLKDNQPVQLRQDSLQIDIPIISCTLEEYAKKKEVFVRPFPFFEGTLIRIEIYSLPCGVKMLCDFHHIIFDGASMDIFLHDLSAAYDGQTIEPENFTSFDLALFEQENTANTFNSDKEFFHTRLGDGEGATVFPTDKQSNNVGSPLTAQASIEKFSVLPYIKNHGVTASNLFLAATALVSSRFASSRSVRIASITNGREGAHVQRNVGMLVKTLPVVLNLNADDNGATFLSGVQQEMAKVLEHQTYSYINASSEYDYSSQLLYAYQGGVISNYKIDGEDITLNTLGLNKAKFPLCVNILEDNQNFIVEIEYDSALYNQNTVHTLAQSIAHVAVQLTKKLGERIGNLCICNEQQLNQIKSFNKAADLPKGSLNQCFERWAQRLPEKTALIASDCQLTFAQLNERANILANNLLSLGVKPEDRIAFMLPRDSRILVSILGIIKAGCAFIPIDPEYPKERIEHVLNDSGARYILAGGDCSLSNSLNIDDMLLGKNTQNPNLEISGDRLCYVIYTSGSTGKPKGVMLTHSGIVNYLVNERQNLHIHTFTQNQCVMASVTTVSFDMFLNEAFPVLMNGLTLVLADEEQSKNPDKLAALFIKTGANVFNATPSRMLQYMVLPQMQQVLSQCKVIVAGGEGYPPVLYKKLREITNATLLNPYGPTEITIASNCKLLENETITVGAPLRGVMEEIMDIDGNPLPVGFTGELWIGGNGVARGYFGNEKMTAERFVYKNGTRWYKSGDLARWTDNGEIVILGRNDGQIKLRGLRIELGEIEHAISAIPEIRSCAVLVRKLHNQEHLCAYYSAERDLPAEELREILLQSLTKYMVPTAYLQMQNLPTTPNGKLDRKKLPDAHLMNRQEYQPPRNEDEKIYCDIFASTLHLERVGATDNFFDMGGTSLLVTQVTIDAAAKGKSLSYGDVFSNPTPRELAALSKDVKEKPDQNDITDYDYSDIHALLKENTLDALNLGTLRELGNVCITGATGFLGIHVLRTFLQTEKGTAFCVVRGKKNLCAEKRLIGMLTYYFGDELLPNGKSFADSFDHLLGNRIVVIDGSITDTKLYQSLQSLPIDTYINCAANVKHFSAGTDIEDINYGGVKLALDFCKRKNCRFVQISTASIGGMSVNGQPDESTLLNEHTFYFGQDLSNKYVRSKFLAERAILQAAIDGLDVKIMRVGNLMARDVDGEFQANFRTNNFLNRLKAYHVVGSIPYEAMSVSTEFAPIDYTAAAVLLLSKTPNSCRVFHPYNDHNVFLGDAVAVLNDLGIKITPCETCQFEKEFSKAMRSSHKAKHLNSLIAYQEHGKRIVPINSVNSYTSQVLLRFGFSWPITSNTYLRKFFTMVESLGFFDQFFDN